MVREIEREYDPAAGATAALDAVRTMTGTAGIAAVSSEMTTLARMTVGWSYATEHAAQESSPGSLSPASSPSGSIEQDTPSAP